MVIIIDDCRECRHHCHQHGTMVLCGYNGITTVRYGNEAPWGPAYITDCPLRQWPEDPADPDDRPLFRD